LPTAILGDTHRPPRFNRTDTPVRAGPPGEANDHTSHQLAAQLRTGSRILTQAGTQRARRHFGRVERKLFWVTDGTCQSAFLATPDGVILFDAPPTIGHNLRRAVDAATAEQGTTNIVTHIVYSHHHADHAGAADLFGDDVIPIGHEDTRRLLLRDNDPTRPAPEVTFQDTYTLELGDERAELAFHGPNHSPDNIFIHFPDHDGRTRG
jgi:glyoxylase-like metal-dependent hydrolase (beta-lactamase superfamily II)